ncbi:MAG: regulatory protein RecX [Candidatus Omnitrophica bacterium]|nr:regulatory protein RecX [Candidatus Omnitrophota bacterium]
MGINDFNKELVKAKTASYRLLKVRTRSEQELRLRLKQKKFSSRIISVVIKEFKRIGLINDIDFAKNWVRSRINKGFGKRRIILELRQKGISPNIIEKQACDIEKNYSPASMIHELTQQRIKRYTSLERSVAQRRIYGFLLRRGFSMDAVLKEIKAL